MKKIILAGLFISQALLLTAQNQPQLPNGDFEIWAPFTPCPGIDSVTNFVTYDQYHYYERKKANLNPKCPSVPSTSKTTDAQHGSYALKITPLKIATNVYEPNAFASDDPTLFLPNSLPFTGRPIKLVGYYKFIKAGNDAVDIQISTTEADGSYIAFGDFTTNTTVTSYTKFEITLDYNPATKVNPSSLLLLVRVGDFPDQSGTQGTELYLDNLHFEYGAPTSTDNYSVKSPINVFAANKHINFSENVSDIHVIDMVGANKMQEDGSTKTLNAALLNAGMYIVTYKYKDNYFSKKVVIE